MHVLLKIALPCLLFLTGAGQALAHGVFIFAWPDGQRVCTESYFSGNSKVRGGTVTMRSADGKALGSAVTDAGGLACFDRPAIHDLRFVVEAGQGHRAEFSLEAKDLGEAPARKSPSPGAPVAGAATLQPITPVEPVVVSTAPPSAGSAPAQANSATGTSSSVAAVERGAEPTHEARGAVPIGAGAPAADAPPVETPEATMRALIQLGLQAEMRTVVREEVQAALGPIRQAIAESKTDLGPRPRDIVGGLGWIMGLATLIHWFMGRRKASGPLP